MFKKVLKNTRAVWTPKLNLRLDRFYINLILSVEQCKCEWINKQAILTHIHIITTVKWNVKEQGRRMHTQITRRCVIEEETEELDVKPPRRPPGGNRSIRQSVGIHGLTRDLLSLLYPMYLSPLSSYSNKASRNHVLSSSPDPATSSMLHLPSLASSNASQQHQMIT